MHDALRRLTLTSDVRAAPVREKITGSRAGTTVPSSTLMDELDAHWRVYERATTHRRRLEAVKAAQDEVLRLTHAPEHSKRGTQAWRDAIRADTRPYRVIASAYGVGIATVSRLKRSTPCD